MGNGLKGKGWRESDMVIANVEFVGSVLKIF